MTSAARGADICPARTIANETSQTKYKQSKTEANNAQHTLQKEITAMRESQRALQMRLPVYLQGGAAADCGTSVARFIWVLAY